MKFIRIFPDTRASTLCPLLNSTRKKAFGSGSTTTPSTSMASSLGDSVTFSRTFLFLAGLRPPRRLCGAKRTSNRRARVPLGQAVDVALVVCDGQHFESVGEHGDRVLEMRGQPSVRRDDGPTVGFRADFPRAGVHHRLD